MASLVPRPTVRGHGCAAAPSPLAYASMLVYAEPYGSVTASPPGCFIRRALGPHTTRHSGAAWGFGRVDHGARRTVPYDPHGDQEARRCPGAREARHHGKGRAGADVQAWAAPAGGRGGMDRAVPSALGGT